MRFNTMAARRSSCIPTKPPPRASRSRRGIIYKSTSMAKAKTSLKSAEKKLRAFALDYPDTTEDFPWGHSAFKVNKKVFLFLATEKGELSMSMKLPKSGKAALKNSFASPTEYGMGKHGWVTSRFAAGDTV